MPAIFWEGKESFALIKDKGHSMAGLGVRGQCISDLIERNINIDKNLNGYCRDRGKFKLNIQI